MRKLGTLFFGILIIGALYGAYHYLSSCRDLNCHKNRTDWFKSMYDPKQNVFLSQQNAQSYLKLIDDPKQRDAISALLPKTSYAVKNPDVPGYIRCAVVGNAGNLLGAGQGNTIDGHDYVFRMNNAPVKGFEDDVGRRTTHHVLHSNLPSLRGYEASTRHLFVVADTWEDYRRSTDMTSYAKKTAVFLKLMSEQFYPGKFKKTLLPTEPSFTEGTHFPENLISPGGSITVVDPVFIKHIRDSWFDQSSKARGTFPSIGFKSLIIAFYLCDQVTSYGFGVNKETMRWDHYYDQGYSVSGPPSIHRWNFQEEFLEQMRANHVID